MDSREKPKPSTPLMSLFSVVFVEFARPKRRGVKIILSEYKAEERRTNSLGRIAQVPNLNRLTCQEAGHSCKSPVNPSVHQQQTTRKKRTADALVSSAKERSKYVWLSLMDEYVEL